MADVGKRNRFVRIYKPLTAVTAANDPTGWQSAPFKAKWAEVRGETGMGSIRSAAAAGGVNTPLDHYSFRVNYDLSIDKTMQLRDREGWCYQIIIVRHDKARRAFTDIVAEFSGEVEASPNSGQAMLDFSDPNNSQYILLFFSQAGQTSIAPSLNFAAADNSQYVPLIIRGF